MSTTQTPQERCKECENQIEEYYSPGYCSERCYYKHKGDKALNLLRHDHRICASCGNFLKEIEAPTDSYDLYVQGPDGEPDENQLKNCLVGYQHLTPNAEWVEKERQSADEYIPLIGTGTGCECGITDTKEIDPDLQELELAKVLSNYVKVFYELYREGQLDQRINKDVFFSEFKASNDLQYALGCALYK